MSSILNFFTGSETQISSFMSYADQEISEIKKDLKTEVRSVVKSLESFEHKYLPPMTNSSIMAQADLAIKRRVQQSSSMAVFPEYPNEDFEPSEWFSNSTYNPYKEAFLIGLSLNTSFPYAGECIGHTFNFVDKTVQFYNNATETYLYTPLEDIRVIYPVLNFTGMIAYDFALVPLDCYEFVIEFSAYFIELWAIMDDDISVFIQAFLFSQMSNAKKFRAAIEAIQSNGDGGSQNYISAFL